MDANFAKPGSLSNELVGDDPDLARLPAGRKVLTGEVVHLHGESHGGVDGSHSLSFEGRDDLAGDLIDVIALVMEFQIGDGAGGGSDGLTIHPKNEGEGGAGSRERGLDFGTVRVEFRSVDGDDSCVGCSAVESELAQAGGGECMSRSGWLCAIGDGGGVIGDGGHEKYSCIYN